MDKEDILLDNSPTISDDYNEDAKILNQQIKNNNVKNIAIVAKLGAGKSSVIETYLHKYRSKKSNKSGFVKLSLSTFNGKEYKEDEIERSILQQLLYSQNKEKLPNSKIERTNKSPFWKSFLLSFILTIFVISSILFGVELSGIILFENVKWTKFLFLGLMIVSFGCMIFNMIYFKSFKKIKYKDFEIETKGDGETNSIINKLIDEILYFFECVNIDLVIFEDLDRLKSNDIFVKLRELNTIINNSKNKKCKKITFLYAVKSEVIEDVEERAKFFDFILSIVPIVNPTSTGEKIREFIKIVNNKDGDLELSEDYIKDISLYIPDMRILKNTFNDYIITRKRIVNEKNKNRISNEKLFTLSLFRNLFPAEYSKLEEKSGVLPILLNKRNLSNVLLQKINNEINNLESQIQSANDEYLTSFDELKFLLKGILVDASCHYRYGSIKVDSITSFENLDYEKLEHPNHNGYAVDLSARDLGRIASVDFAKREKIIKNKSEEKIQEAKHKIEELNKEKQTISNLPYEDLVDKLGIQNIFNNDYIQEDKEFSQNSEDVKLLSFFKFIIKNKYIDDKYSEYTHNLSSSIISQPDIEFIKNVQNGNLDYSYQIENVKEVVARLKKEDFADISIVNKCILKNIYSINNSDKKANLIKTLSSKNEECFKLLLTFFATENDDEIIRLLTTLQSDINLAEKILKSNLTDDKKDLIVNTLLDVQNINDINIDSCITTYFSNKSNIKSLLQNFNLEKVKNIFSVIKPKFSQLTNKLIDDEIIDLIIENNYYEINIENLFFVLRLEGEDCDKILNNVQKYIEMNDLLKDYISSNLNEYISNILLNDRVLNSKENSLLATRLILNPIIDSKCKVFLIEKFDINIENVSLIDKPLLQSIVLNNKMEPTWLNIQFVFENLEDKNILLEFIQNNHEAMSNISVSSDNKELLLYLVNNVNDEETLKCLLGKITTPFNLKDVTNTKNALIVLNANKTTFCETDFNILVKNNDLLVEYLCHFEKQIIQNMISFFSGDICSETLNVILLNNLISVALKQKIIIQFSNKVKIVGFEKEYADLLKNNNIYIKQDILFQFVKTGDEIDKFPLIGLTEFDYADPNTLIQIKDLLKVSVDGFKDLFERNKEFKLYSTEENIKILHKLQEAKILTYSKYKDKLTIKSA